MNPIARRNRHRREYFAALLIGSVGVLCGTSARATPMRANDIGTPQMYLECLEFFAPAEEHKEFGCRTRPKVFQANQNKATRAARGREANAEIRWQPIIDRSYGDWRQQW